MTAADLAWVAGVFEGEGSISFVGKQGVTVKVSMTDEDVIRRLHAITGVGQVGGPYAGTNKPRYAWYVGNKHQVRSLLLALRPWLGERRGQRADEALARTELERTRRWYRRPVGV